MSDNTLLVLAASRYQLPVIVAAKHLGFRVVTLDNQPDNPGHGLADSSWNVDTTDVAAVLNVARRESIGGIIAAATDVAVPTAAAVAHALGLPGVPPAAARVLCDKNRFRAFLSEQGWPCPRAIAVSANTRLPESLFDHPWILKPNTSSGSKGTRIVANSAEYRHQLDATLAFSRDRRGILESYLEGHQITCEGLLLDGRIVFAAITDRQTAPPPHVATHGHRLPSGLPFARQEEVMSRLSGLWEILDVRDGPFDADLVVTDENVYLLEATPRLGGNSLTRLIQSACNTDLITYSIRLAMGENPTPLACPADCRPSGLMLLGVSRPGHLVYDTEQAATLAELPWVEHLSLDYSPGQPVHAFTDGRYRIGEAMVSGHSREQVDQRLKALQEQLALRVAR